MGSSGNSMTKIMHTWHEMHRELEADKAKVARQLASACAAAEDPAWPASRAEQSAHRAAWDAPNCRAQRL